MQVIMSLFSQKYEVKKHIIFNTMFLLIIHF